MTDPKNEERIDRWLARGKSSGPERERWLENILAAAPARKPSPWRSPRLWASGAVGLAMAAGVALFVRQPGDGFTAKGGVTASVAGATAACLDGNASRCARGGTLVFRVEATSVAGFLSAYAVPADAPLPSGDARIWYFPTKEGAPLEVPASATPRAASRGVTLGPEHAAGRYVIHILVTKEPLSRDAVLSAASADVPVLARGTTTVEVTP